MTQDLLKELAQAVIELDDAQATDLAEQALQMGLEPIDVLEQGLAEGLRQIGQEFEAGERFIPELILAAEAMEAAVKVLEPEIARRGQARRVSGRVVIGTVQGDIHSIGKNIVAMMLRAFGFEVFDLGVDVPAEVFLNKAREVAADIIGVSALLTTTMARQRELVETLKQQGARNEFKVMIGGAPTNQQWADQIGADAYAAHATEAVRIAERLMISN